MTVVPPSQSSSEVNPSLLDAGAGGSDRLSLTESHIAAARSAAETAPADSLRRSGQPRAALDYFARIATEDPAFLADKQTSASLYNGWGNALFSLRRFREAREKYELSAAANPAKAVYWSNIGSIRLWCDEWYEAVVAYRKALELSPNFHLAVPGRALAEWRSGLFDEATEHFQAAQAAEPEVIGVCILYCTSLWRAGRYRDARIEAYALCRRYLTHREKIMTTNEIVDLSDAAELFATMLGDFDLAEAALDDAAKADESDFEYAERQLTRAVVAFARAERDVDDRRRLCQEAAAACRSTVHRMQQRFAAHPDDPRVESELQILGRAYLLLDDLKQAQKTLDLALACSAPTCDTLIAHALLSIKQKQYAAAISSLDAALARDPEDVPTRVLLADALYRAGDLERSEAEARAVLRRAPGAVEAHLVLANVSIDLADKGDVDLYHQALGALDRAWQLTGTVVGSKHFSRDAAAMICYLRGYARTCLYNKQDRQDTSLLTQARDDFRQSLNFDTGSHHATMALRKLDQRRSEHRARWINDRLSGGTCAALSLVIFAAAACLFALGKLPPGYAIVFLFGSMIFLIASFYLPQILKLKVGSVELEKASVDGAIAKMPLQIRKVQGQ